MVLAAVVVVVARRKLPGAQPHFLSRDDRGAHAPIRAALPVQDGRTTTSTVAPAVHRPRVTPRREQPRQHHSYRNAPPHFATTLQTKGLPVCHPEKGEGWQTGEGITWLGQGYSLIALH